MKKLLKKIILYLIISFILSGFIISLSIKVLPQYFLGNPIDYNICMSQYDRINSKSNFSNIIIGDSRGNASINPIYLGNNWVNLSIPGSDFFEGFCTIKHYSAKNRIDTLIMVYGMSYIEGLSPYFNSRTIPFGFITPNELESLEKTEITLGLEFHGNKTNTLLGLRKNQLERRLKYIHFPYSCRDTYIDGLFNLMKQKEKDSYPICKSLNLNLGYMNFGSDDSCNSISEENINRTYNPDQINKIYLDSIMTFSKNNNIKTYLIIPPINESTYFLFKNSILESSEINFLNSLARRYSNLKIVRDINYLPNSYFGDPVHLNKNGTIFFSKYLSRIFYDSKY